MSTKYMVLGLLVERPAYGYALAQQIAQRVGFLNLSNTGVYRVLQRLREEGLAEEAGQQRVRPSERLAPRIVYRPTPAGVEAFKQWMAAPSDRPLLRDELQVKLVFAAPDDLPVLLETAETQLQACIADLMEITRPSLATARDPGTPWPSVAQMLVDDFMVKWLESTVDWLTATVEVIRGHLAEHAPRESD